MIVHTTRSHTTTSALSTTAAWICALALFRCASSYSLPWAAVDAHDLNMRLRANETATLASESSSYPFMFVEHQLGVVRMDDAITAYDDDDTVARTLRGAIAWSEAHTSNSVLHGAVWHAMARTCVGCGAEPWRVWQWCGTALGPVWLRVAIACFHGSGHGHLLRAALPTPKRGRQQYYDVDWPPRPGVGGVVTMPSLDIALEEGCAALPMPQAQLACATGAYDGGQSMGAFDGWRASRLLDRCANAPHYRYACFGYAHLYAQTTARQGWDACRRLDNTTTTPLCVAGLSRFVYTLHVFEPDASWSTLAKWCSGLDEHVRAGCVLGSVYSLAEFGTSLDVWTNATVKARECDGLASPASCRHLWLRTRVPTSGEALERVPVWLTS